MLNLIKLESRIVLDGAAVGEALDHAADHEANINAENAQVSDCDAESHGDVAGAAALLAEPDASAQALDIILISDDLPDYQQLADAAKPGTAVIVYDADAESAQDVIGRAAALSESEGKEISSLTILSHGGAGYFELGNEAVKAENLNSFSDAWTALDAAMKDDGHIYIYGCSTANGEGLSLLDSLAEATHSRVFASDDMTGGSGDWDLETASENSGDENPAPPLNFDLLAGYEGELTKIAVPTAITSIEDQPGLFGIFIYGTGENSGSRDADSVTRTGTLPSLLTNASVHYDGWITDQPITIEGQTITEYHRWSVNYTPAQDAFTNDGTYSSAMLNFKIAEENQTFTTDVTILPVNDPPDFEYSDADQRVSIEDGTVTVTVDEDSGTSGLVTIDDFATDIIAGPDNEASQKVKFIVQDVTVEIDGDEVDSSELFDVLPSIAPVNYSGLSAASGNLTFTLKDNAYGTAVVSVLLQDDGGTLYGGDDTSAVKTFVINVKPVNDNPNAPEINDVYIYEDNGNPDNDYAPTAEAQVEGFRVDEFIESITDPDVGGEIPIAIAITDISTDMDGDGDSDGKWQFQMAGTTQWTTITESSLSGDKALLLTADDKIRFIPNADFNSEEPSSATEPYLTVKSWDQTGASAGKEGTYYSIASTDTAFSKDAVDVPLEVKAVNDAPELWKDDALMPDTDGPYKANNGTVVIEDISVKDVDIARGEGDKRVQVTLDAELDAGKISLGTTTGLTFVTGDGTDDNRMVFTGLLSNVNAALSSLTYKYDGTVTAPVTTDTVTLEVNDLGNYGVPGAKTDTSLIKIDLNQGPGVGEVDEIFIEGCAAVPVADGIQDAEGDDIRSVTISFKDSTFVAGQDVLHYSTAAASNIVANYNSQTGTLTLTVAGGGTASASDFKNVLDTVTYENTSDTPNTTQRKFNIVSVDEYGNSGTTESVVSVVPVNDAPIANMPDSVSTLSDTSIVISNISLGDVDMSAGFVHMVIQADHGALSIGQDAISRIVSSGGSVNGNGSASVTITAKLADVAPGGTLTALTYTPTAGYSGTDGIKFTINDQGYTGFFREGEIICQLTGYLRTILDENGQLPENPDDGTPSDPDAQEIEDVIPVIVIPPNTPPEIDLDPDGDGGDGPNDGTVGPVEPDTNTPPYLNDHNVYFIEPTVKDTNGDGTPDEVIDCTPVHIADITDPNPLIVDAQGDNIAWMEIRLTNPKDGDTLAADVAGTGITIVSNGIEAGTGQLVLKFSGEASAAQYDQVLRTVTFDNESNNPDPTLREIKVTASDVKNAVGAVATSRVAVVPVNDPPVNTVPGEQGTTIDTAIDFEGNIHVTDPDAGTGDIRVELSVENGTLSLKTANSGNGTSQIVIVGKVDEVNALLKGLVYTPNSGYTGTDILTVKTTDQGYTGVSPDFISKNAAGICVVGEGVDGNGYTFATGPNGETILLLTPTGSVIRDPVNGGTPADYNAQTDIDYVPIQVMKSGPPPVEPPPQPPTPPAPPIVSPGEAELGGIPLEAVRLPGAFGMIEGERRPGLSIRAEGGISLTSALWRSLKIGCRFANTRDPEAQFNSVSWDFLTDLGWTEPWLDEEFDLYSRLFLRQKGDPGFNIPAGAFEIDLGSQPIQKPLVFQQGGGEISAPMAR
ncbi:MAG: DUF4347 domain-containing protein [Desulfobacterales bacterium]